MTVGLGAALLVSLLAIWPFGGPLLRAAALLLFAGGALWAVVGGDAIGALVAGFGALLWLAGHWLYALRHQQYKSPLARQVFCRWAPRWLDPTRSWTVSATEEDSPRRPR